MCEPPYCNYYNRLLLGSRREEQKNSMKIKSTVKAGFTLVEIMIVVAIIGLLAAIAVPNFVKARTTAQKNACINNLRQIDGAIQQWALETKQGSTADVVFTEVMEYLKNEVKCPSAGMNKTAAECYTVTKVNDLPPVSCNIEPATHSLLTSEAPSAPAE
jgi:prepilin-type N-terminal cleavage/methylation domain-containing protein